MTPNRMLNPRTGRWSSPDPHWDIRTNAIFGDSPTMRNDRYMPSIHAILQSGNLFMFVMHNPVRWVDSSGLFAVCPTTTMMIEPSGLWICPITLKHMYQMAKPYLYKAWDGTKWLGSKAWDGTKWLGNQAWNGAKSAGNWVRGLFGRGSSTTQFGGARLQTGSNMRDSLLNTAQNTNLRNLIDQLYRPGAHIGDGGTAAILVNEFIRGVTPQHLQKANEMIGALQNLFKNHGSTMSFNDIEIALQLLTDLKLAVGLFS